jgi:2-keto-3-deoxy-L-rhamnonate aldolase RhmA
MALRQCIAYEVQRMVERASSLAHAAGKPIGIVAGNPQMPGRFMS